MQAPVGEYHESSQGPSASTTFPRKTQYTIIVWVKTMGTAMITTTNMNPSLCAVEALM
jgi:hypothetical protein